MNLPNLKEAKVRTKNKVDIVNNAYNIPEEVKNIGKNKKYHIITYGCQMNVHDSENISAIMEDLGYLPRIAFNMDKCFKKACTNGKQMITMCMGFGCNAAGVCGCKIIDSPRERLIAILTNAFVPCNGRFPFLITIATIFIAASFTGFTASIVSTLAVVCVILLGIIMSLLISKLNNKFNILSLHIFIINNAH